MHRETLENLGRSRSAEKHAVIVFGKEVREGPNAVDKSERLMVETDHHLEDISFTWYSGERAGQISVSRMCLGFFGTVPPHTPDTGFKSCAKDPLIA